MRQGHALSPFVQREFKLNPLKHVVPWPCRVVHDVHVDRPSSASIEASQTHCGDLSQLSQIVSVFRQKNMGKLVVETVFQGHAAIDCTCE